MPFGALQTIAILIGCFAAYRLKLKSAVLSGLMVLVSVIWLDKRTSRS